MNWMRIEEIPPLSSCLPVAVRNRAPPPGKLALRAGDAGEPKALPFRARYLGMLSQTELVAASEPATFVLPSYRALVLIEAMASGAIPSSHSLPGTELAGQQDYI